VLIKIKEKMKPVNGLICVKMLGFLTDQVWLL